MNLFADLEPAGRQGKARKSKSPPPETAGLLRDCRHADRANYADAPPRGGWIRTTCRRCGGFIGCRPAEPKRPKGRREAKPHD